MKFVFAILTALAFSTTALAVTDEEEARYVKSFSGDQCLHSDAADTFAWMGISDTRVCDIVEKRLLEDHQVAHNDRHKKTALPVIFACSPSAANPNTFQPSTTLSPMASATRYVKAALEDLPQYQK